MSKKKKIRTEFRKKHESRARQRDVTRAFAADEEALEQAPREERLTGKGELTRKRTIIGEVADVAEGGFAVQRDVDRTQCVHGLVLRVLGRVSVVAGDDGQTYRAPTRRLLKTLSTDLRHVVVAGDQVWVRAAAGQEGFIERIEPRRSLLCRTSRGRQHAIAANIDRVLIVASAAEPNLKPNLIDRFLITAEKSHIRPIICINKVDLVDPAALQPLVGVYGQMGYTICLLSATTGFGIPRLRRLVAGQTSVVAGQSGVGKSSLLNAIEPGLRLKVQEVSRENEKGRHTTTTAQFIPLAAGGYLVDTPGIRQFQLWDVVPQEIANFFRDLRPYVSLCRFPNCTHTHEDQCAIKDAVADGHLDARRYESYCQLLDE